MAHVAPGERPFAHRRGGAVAFLDAADGGAGGIVERAQHAGDVAQRRHLAMALGDGAVRLALEIDEGDVVLDDEDLDEVSRRGRGS